MQIARFRLSLLLLLSPSLSLAYQNSIPAASYQYSSVPVPQLYHFIRHAAHLSRKATASDSSFGSNGDDLRRAFYETTGLSSAQAAAFLAVAVKLDEEFGELDAEAAKLIAETKRKLKPGDLIPPPPPELDQLQAQKTALMNSVANLLAAQLDADTNRLLAEHLKRSNLHRNNLPNQGNSNAN